MAQSGKSNNSEIALAEKEENPINISKENFIVFRFCVPWPIHFISSSLIFVRKFSYWRKLVSSIRAKKNSFNCIDNEEINKKKFSHEKWRDNEIYIFCYKQHKFNNDSRVSTIYCYEKVLIFVTNLIFVSQDLSCNSYLLFWPDL